MVGIKNVEVAHKKTFRSVPIIDFSGLSDPKKRSAICAQVSEAWETVELASLRSSTLAFLSNPWMKLWPSMYQDKMTLRPENVNKEKWLPFNLATNTPPCCVGSRTEWIFRSTSRPHEELVATQSPRLSRKGRKFYPFQVIHSFVSSDV